MNFVRHVPCPTTTKQILKYVLFYLNNFKNIDSKLDAKTQRSANSCFRWHTYVYAHITTRITVKVISLSRSMDPANCDVTDVCIAIIKVNIIKIKVIKKCDGFIVHRTEEVEMLNNNIL